MHDAPTRRPRRILRFAALALLLLLAVTAIYASTQRGFQRLWLPLARAVLDAEVTAASGRIDLRGRLEVRGLEVHGEAFDADVAHARIDLGALAIPPWRRPWVQELRVESARVVLWETTDAAKAAEEAEAEPEADSGGGLPPRLRPIPVRVARAELRDVVVEGRTRGEETPHWHVGLGRATVRRVAPGQEGVVALETRWHLPGAPEELREGRLVLDVELDEPLPDPESPADARPPATIAVRGDLETGPVGESPAPLRVTAVGRGRLDTDGEVDLERLEVDAVERGTRLGVLRARGRVAPFAGRLDLEVEGDAQPAAPLLARLGLPEGLHAVLAPADAALRARVHGDPDATHVDGSVRFDGLDDDPQLPPSLDLAARLARTEDGIELEAFSLRGLGADGADRGALRGSGRVAEDGSVGLDLASDALPVAPWLARLGVALPPSYGPLPVDAALRLELGPDGGSVEGEGSLDVEAGSHPDLARSARFRLGRVLVGWKAGALEVELEGEGPPAPKAGREAGRLRLSLEREAATPRPRLAVDLRLEGLDATALVPRSPDPDEPAADDALAAAEAEAAAEEEAGESADARSGPALDLPLALEAALALDAVAVRSLHVGRLRVEARGAGEELALTAEGEDLAGGSLSLDFARALDGEEVDAHWSLRVAELGLEPLLHALDADGSRVAGRLDLESEGAGRAPRAKAGLLASAGGHLQFRLREAHAQNLRVQRVAAARAGLDQLLSLNVADAQGRLPIEEGSLRFEGVQVDGSVVHFHIDGTLSPERIDLMVNPRLGPDMAAGFGLQNVLFAPVSSLVALPFVVTVRGPLGATGIGVRPATPALLGDVVGLASGALQGAVNGAGGLVKGSTPEAEGDAAMPAEGEGAEPGETSGSGTPPVAAPGAAADAAAETEGLAPPQPAGAEPAPEAGASGATEAPAAPSPAPSP